MPHPHGERTPRRRSAVPLALASAVLLAASLLTAVTPPAPAAALGTDESAQALAVPGEIVHTLTRDGKTVTVRLSPIAMRGPGFEVLLQQADGSLVPQPAGEERSYLGTVDGDPFATAAGIVRSDGSFEGLVVFDRGATWFFVDDTVTGTRGITPPANFTWPTASNPVNATTVTPGQSGAQSHHFDVGFDLANNWLNDPATIGGSVAKAIDAVEMTAVSLLPLYEGNAKLRPMTGRVIIRGDAEAQPYRAGEPTAQLNAVTAEWGDNQADADVDNVLFLNLYGGGGLGWVGTSGTTHGTSHNSDAGFSRAMARHEMGHNWGANDMHSGGPEGPTVMSGNAFARFDGTELSAIFRYRDRRQAESSSFDPIGTFDRALPPYAALDLVDSLNSGVPVSFRPLANDHDANDDALTLVSIGSSHRGGTASRSGDVVTYVPPQVTAQTVDWIEYVVQDSSGARATGVALFRVDPATDPGDPAQWTDSAVVAGVPYDFVNRQSSFSASNIEGGADRLMVQRAFDGDDSRYTLIAAGNGAYRLKNVTRGDCVSVENGSLANGARVVHTACLDSAAGQRWQVKQHPKGGSVLRNVVSGKCVTPVGGSMTSGATLVQDSCGLSLAQSWEVRLATAPPKEWMPRTDVVTSVPYRITNVNSGLAAGLPDGSGPRLLVQREDATFTLKAKGSGNYELYVPGSGNLCVEQGASSQAGTWYCGDDNPKRFWRFVENPAGDLSVMNASSGSCLEVADGSTASGAAIKIAPCGVHPHQRWTLDPVHPAVDEWTAAAVSTEVPYALENTAAGLPAGVPEGTATGSASSLVVRPASGTATQFRFDALADGSYRIRNEQTQGCVDVYGASTADGAKVGTWGCSGAANQKFTPLVNPAGGVSFRSVSSGLCLTTKNGATAAGTELAQTACAIARSQRWDAVAQVAPVDQWEPVDTVALEPRTLQQVASGLYAATSNPGLSAGDLALNGSTLSGQFTFTQNAAGQYLIRNVARNACVDVYRQSTAVGAQVGTWSCSATSLNQRWVLLENPAGGVALRGAQSGLCLASQGDGTAAGTLLVQTTCGIGRTQRWTLGGS